MNCKALALGLVFAFAPDACFAAQAAEQSAGQVTVKTGTPTVVRRWWNCKGNLPAVSSAAASHGSMALQVSSGNRCGKPNQPVLQLVYTPPPGFRGQDDGFFYYTRWTFRLSITVE